MNNNDNQCLFCASNRDTPNNIRVGQGRKEGNILLNQHSKIKGFKRKSIVIIITVNSCDIFFDTERLQF